MLSFLLPQNVNLFFTSGFIKREGPFGSFIKNVGGLSFNTIVTSEGTRVYVSDAKSETNATALSHLYSLAQGLSRGYRRRLRLVGIGFRAMRRPVNTPEALRASHTKNYRQKRRRSLVNQNPVDSQLLALKIGYSHEYVYPVSVLKGMNTKVSRLEGRSKGTLISLQSNNRARTNQVASEIRSFRLPDIYKGKGIYLDREVLKLKKGKRQG